MLQPKGTMSSKLPSLHPPRAHLQSRYQVDSSPSCALPQKTPSGLGLLPFKALHENGSKYEKKKKNSRNRPTLGVSENTQALSSVVSDARVCVSRWQRCTGQSHRTQDCLRCQHPSPAPLMLPYGHPSLSSQGTHLTLSRSEYLGSPGRSHASWAWAQGHHHCAPRCGM